MGYTVKSMLVIATDGLGVRHHLYQGQPLPAYIGQDELDRLAADGLIAKVEEPAEEVPSFDRPAGNASQEAWATYAMESGQASEDEVKGLTRDELRELYG